MGDLVAAENMGLRKQIGLALDRATTHLPADEWHILADNRHG
jgi:hypothetical protein